MFLRVIVELCLCRLRGIKGAILFRFVWKVVGRVSWKKAFFFLPRRSLRGRYGWRSKVCGFVANLTLMDLFQSLWDRCQLTGTTKAYSDDMGWHDGLFLNVTYLHGGYALLGYNLVWMRVWGLIPRHELMTWSERKVNLYFEPNEIGWTDGAVKSACVEELSISRDLLVFLGWRRVDE